VGPTQRAQLLAFLKMALKDQTTEFTIFQMSLLVMMLRAWDI